MAKHNNETNEKSYEFGAHFSYSDLCERLKKYSNSTVYHEKLKEIQIDQISKDAKQHLINNTLKKKIKVESMKEFINIKTNSKIKGSCNDQVNKNEIQITNHNSFNFKDKFRIFNTKENRKHTIDNEIKFPIIQTEISPKSKKNIIKLSKIDKNTVLKNNCVFHKDIFRMPHQNSDLIRVSPKEKIKISHYFKNLSDNVSEKKVMKIRLPSIKK